MWRFGNMKKADATRVHQFQLRTDTLTIALILLNRGLERGYGGGAVTVFCSSRVDKRRNLEKKYEWSIKCSTYVGNVPRTGLVFVQYSDVGIGAPKPPGN